MTHSSAPLAFLLALATIAAASPAPAQDCETFRRGDGNADGAVNIADPVATLNFLFSGGAAAPCEDAADANDTGELDISDAVFTLNFLFLGGAPPPAPGVGACGRDPTLDRLACLVSSCQQDPIRIDESGFTVFHYSLHPGLGFCPGVDSVFEANIEKTGNGSYRFEHSVLEERSPGDPGCLPDVITGACLVAVTRPARDLTPAEAERVLAEFAEVQIRLENSSLCDCIAFDPCRIQQFSWDGALASDFLCGAPFLDGDEAAGISDLLESLRAGP